MPYNITDLGRKLHYPKSGSFNELVNDLIKSKMLQPIEGGRFLKVTVEGSRKIRPLILGRVFSLIVVMLAFIPIMWGVSELMFSVPVSVLTLFGTGALMALAGGALLYLQIDLERRILEVD